MPDGLGLALPNEASCVNAECTLPNELEVANPGETDASWSQDPLGENSPNICPPKWGTCLHVSRFVFFFFW